MSEVMYSDYWVEIELMYTSDEIAVAPDGIHLTTVEDTDWYPVGPVMHNPFDAAELAEKVAKSGYAVRVQQVDTLESVFLSIPAAGAEDSDWQNVGPTTDQPKLVLPAPTLAERQPGAMGDPDAPPKQLSREQEAEIMRGVESDMAGDFAYFTQHYGPDSGRSMGISAKEIGGWETVASAPLSDIIPDRQPGQPVTPNGRMEDLPVLTVEASEDGRTFLPVREDDGSGE